METKPVWQSKTVLMNLIFAIAAFFPPMSGWLNAHPDYVIFAFSLLNMGLRLISKGKIEIV